MSRRSYLNWRNIEWWIKSTGIPEDSKIETVYPIDPITDKPDGRLWIEVISESYGFENCSDPYDPESDFYPVVAQYMLVPVNLVYKLFKYLEPTYEPQGIALAALLKEILYGGAD